MEHFKKTFKRLLNFTVDEIEDESMMIDLDHLRNIDSTPETKKLMEVNYHRLKTVACGGNLQAHVDQP